MKIRNCIFVIICIFVVQSRLGEIRDYLFTIRDYPRVTVPKGCTPFLERDCNPKGNLAHKYIFEMQSENQFVTAVALRNGVTSVSEAFYEKFFSYLPTSKTETDAFYKASLDYYNLFQTFPYLSYKHFKTGTYGKA